MSSVITDKARILHSRFYEYDTTVPSGREFQLLLTSICRDAATSARQSEENCSYEWADTPAYRKRMEQCDARLQKHSTELAKLWPGSSLMLAGDPRGYVVSVMLPKGRNEAWGGVVGVA